VSTLRELQQGFAGAIFDAQAATAFSGHILAKGLDATRRLQIYRNNHHCGLSEALAAVFPVTRRLVGEAFFAQTARRYVQQVRSLSGDIHHYGDAFAAFLAGLPELDDYPYLPDVARLEWAWHSVFHSAVDAPFQLAGLQGIAPQDYAALGFRLQHAARLLASGYPVLRIWQVNQDDWCGEQRVQLDAGADYLLVMRAQQAVSITALDAAEYQLLAGLAGGAPLVAALQSALAADAAFDLAAALAKFLNGGVLVECLTPSARRFSHTDPNQEN
jgi:hypothetical protein